MRLLRGTEATMPMCHDPRWRSGRDTATTAPTVRTSAAAEPALESTVPPLEREQSANPTGGGAKLNGGKVKDSVLECWIT